MMDNYTRELVYENTKIKSVCRRCGFKIIASVSKGLIPMEKFHTEVCRETFGIRLAFKATAAFSGPKQEKRRRREPSRSVA
jgi:hypothetical protein